VGWVFLASLANRWLWLLAAFATAVLLATGQVPVWFALLSGVATLAVGAGVGAAGQVRRSQIGSAPRPGKPAAIRRPKDEAAAAYLDRAMSAVQRLERVRKHMADVPADLSADVGARADQMLGAMSDTGQQVDRLDAMLAGVDVPALRSELADVKRALAKRPRAADALLAQRRLTVKGLRAQLAAVDRVAEQRALMLERMRTTAVGLEGLAVRMGEIGALYDASGRVDTTDDDLRSVTAELDGLRAGLVEAERTVHDALSTTELPGIRDDRSPPRQS
jgi:hypothetical protein